MKNDNCVSVCVCKDGRILNEENTNTWYRLGRGEKQYHFKWYTFICVWRISI